MFSKMLHTTNNNILLVRPDLQRDPQTSVSWLKGDEGRKTLSLMGVSDKDNVEPKIKDEFKRIKGFIDTQEQYNWMISYKGQIVGSIWVDLKPRGSVPAPGIHIMIGDPNFRGKGVGYESMVAVISYLKTQGYRNIYSRHLVSNSKASEMSGKLGFIHMGSPYIDDDGLNWQNIILKLLDKPSDNLINSDGLVTRWPKKKQERIFVLEYLAGKFQVGKTYTESDINTVLKRWHSFNDWCVLRRELVVAGYLVRNIDGTKYSVSGTTFNTI